VADSFWPAALATAKSKRGQQILQAVVVAVTVYAIPWLDGRASDEDVAKANARIDQVRDRVRLVMVDDERPKLDDEQKPITLSQQLGFCRVDLFALRREVEEMRRAQLALRADLVGMQAASAEPRWQVRRQTAAAARASFWDELSPDDQPRPGDLRYQREAAAYRHALETRPPLR